METQRGLGPLPDDPAVLGAISAPVLLLHGSDTKPFLSESAQYVADHVPNARMHEIPGAGHAAPLTHPEALAEALTRVLLVSAAAGLTPRIGYHPGGRGAAACQGAAALIDTPDAERGEERG